MRLIFEIEFYFCVFILILISSNQGQQNRMNGTIMFDLETNINAESLQTAFHWYALRYPLFTGVSDGELNFNDFPRPPLNATLDDLLKTKEDIEKNRTYLTFGINTYFGQKLTRLNISTPTRYSMNYFPIFNFPLSMHISIVETLNAYIDRSYGYVNTRTLIVLNSDMVDPLQPWERIDALDPLLRNITGMKYFIYYHDRVNEIISKIRDAAIDSIILMVNATGTSKILKAAYSTNLLKWQRRWLIYLTASSNLNIFDLDIDEHSTNITIVQFADLDVNSTLRMKDSLSCVTYDSLVIGLQILNKVYLNKVYLNESATTDSTIVPGKTGNFTIDFSKLSEYPPTTAVVRNTWTMHIYQGLGFHAHMTGSISGTPNNSQMTWKFPTYSKLDVSTIDVKEPFTHNVFRVVTSIEEPYLMFKPDAHKYHKMKDKLEGLIIDILEALMKSVNISYEIILDSTSIHGTLQSDGRWNGLLEYIVDGKAELAAAPFSITPERQKAVDFLISFLTVEGTLLYKENVDSTIAIMFQFIFPFDAITWAAIGGAALGVIILLAIVNCIVPNKIKLNLIETTFFTLGSLTIGQIPIFPNRHSSGVIVCVWWFFSLIIFIVYTCNWGAYRLETLESSKIDGLSSLPNLVNYEYGTVKGSVYENILLSASEGYLKRINKMVRHEFHHGLVDNITQAVNYVNQGNYAFIWDSAITQYYAYKNCWKSVGGFDKFEIAFAVPLFSDYKDLLNQHLRLLKDHGNISLIKEKYEFLSGSKNSSCGFLGDSAIMNAIYTFEFRQIAQYFFDGALQLQQTLGIFIVILVSCALVLIFSFIEAGIRLYCRRLVDKRGDAIKTKKESHA